MSALRHSQMQLLRQIGLLHAQRYIRQRTELLGLITMGLWPQDDYSVNSVTEGIEALAVTRVGIRPTGALAAQGIVQNAHVTHL